MARKAPQLAKLSCPRLHKAVARPRLYNVLDAARKRHAAAFVAGPPGAGKTTLVASWLESRKLDGIWYQVDAGDADLATFFYYLGVATTARGRRGARPLPLLTPEYLGDVHAFARRFFRELFERLPGGSTLVFDNFQDAGALASFHLAVGAAMEEAPAGSTIVIVSRGEPPEAFARLRANQSLAVMSWEDLKLTAEEAHSIAQRHRQLESDDVDRMHRLSSGWAAGLVLMLERAGRGDWENKAEVAEPPREIFDYIAAQIVDRFEGPARAQLMALSYLPRMTALMAVAVTGTPAAAELLEDLHRRQLFVDRRGAGEPVFQFHALFHSFLQHRAQQELPPSRQREVALHAAQLLEASGRPDEAFGLCLRAGATDAASQVVLRHAAKLIEQGRWQVVVEWIGSLPHPLVESECWLLHWDGTARIAVDPERARTRLEQCCKVASESGDIACRVQAAAGIIQTYMLEYTRFRPLDPWMEMLEACITPELAFGTPDAELRAQAALFVSLAYRKPDSPRLHDCAERVFSLLQTEAEANLRAVSAAYLVVYGVTTGPPITGHRARPTLIALLDHPDVTALTAGWAWFVLSYAYCVLGAEKEAREAVDHVQRIGNEHGFTPLMRLAAIAGCWGEIGAGRLSEAQTWLERLEGVMSFDNPYDVASSASLKGHIALCRDEAGRAKEPIALSVKLYDEAGTHFQRTFARIQLAMDNLMLGDAGTAGTWAAEALVLARMTGSGWIESQSDFVLAQIAMASADEPGVRSHLEKALSMVRRLDCSWQFRVMRPWMPTLLSTALDMGIEVDTVREAIRRHRFAAPSLSNEGWPWPVRVYAFGQFRILLDGEPISFARKAPKKVIALLKAIIALGSVNVPVHALIDALWPDTEGDVGQESFQQALHRLRRLLAIPESVRVEGGKVSLNEQVVWTDVRAFSETLRFGDPEEHRIREALALYRGGFLDDEAQAPWAVLMRERLRTAFLRGVEAAGARLEEATRWPEAIDLYVAGLDADPLAEAFYQGLMRSYAALDRRAEAIGVYRRMRNQLSVVLGMKPSATTEKLARELRLEA